MGKKQPWYHGHPPHTTPPLFFLNSLAYARVTQHCTLSRSPQPNTTNYFCGKRPHVGGPHLRVYGPSLLWRYGGGREGRSAELGRPPTTHPPTCHFHMSSPPEREPGAVWQVRAVNVSGWARPGGGARGAEPCPAARLLAPAAQTSHLAADSCGTSERNIRPDNWRRKVKRV